MKPLPHAPKNFNNLLGTLKLSDKQLQAHFGLYEGYVKKYNEIQEKLATADPTGGNYSFNEFSELKRREAVAFNGAFLHESYFENMSGEKSDPSPELMKAFTTTFGSFDTFLALMKGAASSTPGWVILTWNKVEKRLHPYIMFEHHIGYPVHQEAILSLDCWEHAFMIDFGTKKADYLTAFFSNVNWPVVNKRFALLTKNLL